MLPIVCLSNHFRNLVLDILFSYLLLYHFFAMNTSSYNMSRWSARFGFEKTGKQILEKAKNGCNGRYVAVNLNNYHTIEFRLFRGTLKYNTFIATLQMVNHICDVAISFSEEGIDAMSWSEFVSSIEEPELIQYLKERRLYVNEYVTESEKM